MTGEIHLLFIIILLVNINNTQHFLNYSQSLKVIQFTAKKSITLLPTPHTHLLNKTPRIEDFNVMAKPSGFGDIVNKSK